ncbi:MAG: hypothetical protein ABIK28_12510 [Planctomycetota bacterium]
MDIIILVMNAGPEAEAMREHQIGDTHNNLRSSASLLSGFKL